ncbi:putative MFS family arabinose efflux permease [Neolewinella xylanilytica]|uniref:Putative MFS family arabinose efflux permease n=1 Tax=Neolewinella xylanilytica TaxID=1514080 RepID=A0A2S6I590_9BACT|nr:putative MFS family arabinose efflux permease [Neolewinella xylanilytica]
MFIRIERSASLLRTRIAVALAFAINGLVYANWTSRLPRLQELYGIDNGQTGFVLTSLAVGSLIAMPLAGYLIVKNGSRRLAVVSTVGFILVVPLMAYMPGYAGLLLLMPLVGISTGVMDVAINAQAVEVEKLWGQPITSSFHACFSGGMFVGAGIAAAFIYLGMDLGPHFLVISLITSLLSIYALRNFLNDGPDAGPEIGPGAGRFGLAIVLLGLASLCTMIGEGAMADWTPLYMTRVTGSTEAIAPFGQAAFSGAMLLGRSFGDGIRGRLGSRIVIVGGALVALVGVMAAILYPVPAVAIAGFGLVGLGLSNIIPVVFSQASRVPGLRSGVGISSVSTIGYSAFLWGPPAIGFVSDYQNALLPGGIGPFDGVVGLRVGLGVVALLMVLLFILSAFYLRVED